MAIGTSTVFVVVKMMVCSAGPHANVIEPPPATPTVAHAASNAASVQLPGVPVPTTSAAADPGATWPTSSSASSAAIASTAARHP
jgi:hypothetical protein